ncbi:hypothetical protein K435DRAFT_390679 [Dendrothele bispora CBS 962.96]|uniref:Uncharacterized protein n=1 Tax=Dendrothele bispora (strain CBS 962.96) TaxID=1314807 RepID=A0A4S8L9R6_DENBC|nr:hypothetical protein K435DRAFT_390679 [Dendrothele bispora CBS 962.96]
MYLSLSADWTAPQIWWNGPRFVHVVSTEAFWARTMVYPRFKCDLLSSHSVANSNDSVHSTFRSQLLAPTAFFNASITVFDRNMEGNISVPPWKRFTPSVMSGLTENLGLLGLVAGMGRWISKQSISRRLHAISCLRFTSFKLLIHFSVISLSKSPEVKSIYPPSRQNISFTSPTRSIPHHLSRRV